MKKVPLRSIVDGSTRQMHNLVAKPGSQESWTSLRSGGPMARGKTGFSILE